jgi:hypothetical protein
VGAGKGIVEGVDEGGVRADHLGEFVGRAVEENDGAIVACRAVPLSARHSCCSMAHAARKGLLLRMATALTTLEWPTISPTELPLS